MAKPATAKSKQETTTANDESKSAKNKTAKALTADSTLDSLRATITHSAFTPESEAVAKLLEQVDFSRDAQQRIHDRAVELVSYMREHTSIGVDSFLSEYRLDHREGVLIMCLAEALLRIPDAETANRLIEDKFTDAEWERYVGHSESFLVNASSWGLMLTGKVINFEKETEAPLTVLRKIIHRTGAPIIRQALMRAIEWMGTQFILGRTIEEGIENAESYEKRGYTHSYDMLGEGARTLNYAEDYAAKYLHAIEMIGKAAPSKETNLLKRPAISIKLSALHPRYEGPQKQTVMDNLVPQLITLLQAAKKHNLIASIDAEEAYRLDVSLDVFERVLTDPSLQGWNGVSIVVQAYQKRAIHIIHWLAALAERHNKCIPVRLVKGAYWDTEIKLCQIHGTSGYPVFTEKFFTDVSYLACARALIDYGDRFYPMFATHNAQTVASIIEMAGPESEYEFQRLHGMGGQLFDQIMGKEKRIPCRVYAPIGVHKDLLAYLVRRLLENGANSSFINQLADKSIPVEKLIDNPVVRVREQLSQGFKRNIPLPSEIYGPTRKNSEGHDIGYYAEVERLYSGMGPYINRRWHATSIIQGESEGMDIRNIINPANKDDEVGTAAEANDALTRLAIDHAADAFPQWAKTPAKHRADILRKAADILHDRQYNAIALIVREAGRTLNDAIDEVREAIDFLRYYAREIETLCGSAVTLPGPTGEDNHLFLRGRGIFACISPWNFPLAIFTGQIAAALAAGNTVIAKPAEQTPIIAWFMTQILHEAGIPKGVLHLVLGDGPSIGAVLTSDPRISGVVFTGSTEVAQLINKKLASRGGPIVPLIAETGGQNCMVVDSTALPEQVCDDVVHSAFGSAGQRCSSLRVLFVQDEIANTVIDMISGALDLKEIGNPWELNTDIGPVIDADAKQMLDNYKATMERKARLIYEHPINKRLNKLGTFVGPAIFEIQRISELKREVFGPILHVIRYQAEHLDDVIDAINSTGYGLTLGIHSRIDESAHYIAARVRSGNCYINRGMTGAVVGVQPFGGEGLSGTGPKAGGPHYLLRFMNERTITINTAAIGGNLALYTEGQRTE